MLQVLDSTAHKQEIVFPRTFVCIRNLQTQVKRVFAWKDEEFEYGMVSNRRMGQKLGSPRKRNAKQACLWPGEEITWWEWQQRQNHNDNVQSCAMAWPNTDNREEWRLQLLCLDWVLWQMNREKELTTYPKKRSLLCLFFSFAAQTHFTKSLCNYWNSEKPWLPKMNEWLLQRFLRSQNENVFDLHLLTGLITNFQEDVSFFGVRFDAAVSSLVNPFGLKH